MPLLFIYLFFGLCGSAYKVLVRRLQTKNPCVRGGMAGKIILDFRNTVCRYGHDWTNI